MAKKRFPWKWIGIAIPVAFVVVIVLSIATQIYVLLKDPRGLSPPELAGERIVDHCGWRITRPSDLDFLCDRLDKLFSGGPQPIDPGDLAPDFCRLHPAFCELEQPMNAWLPDHAELEGEVCRRLGTTSPCTTADLLSGLERDDYAFNAPSEIGLGEGQSIALVIDTTGQTDFNTELSFLPGTLIQGTTPVSLFMEAEIVGPAFEIEPEGRQRRRLTRMNPTRWDWEVTPTRSGQHHLEVSMYVIATSDGEDIAEEKALAERQIIQVTVPRLNRVRSFLEAIDPLLGFIITIGGLITAILAWFGYKSWRDMAGGNDDEPEPQKIEITIKNSQSPQKDD